MDWMKEISGLLGQYSGANSQGAPDETEHHFSQVAGVAPRQEIAGGLNEAFRSDQTPPFPDMLSNLFGNSNGQQRAGLLNMLLGAAGPAMLGGVLGRYGLNSQHVTPEEAERLPPEAAGEIARAAEKQDPSIIDRVSDFYADQPMVVKALGAGALAMILSRMANRRF
jgi:hypothetical protein